MNWALGWLGGILCLGLGGRIARKALGFQGWVDSIALGTALGIMFLAAGANCFARLGLSLRFSLLGAMIALGLLSFVLEYRKDDPRPPTEGTSWQWWLLGLAAIFLWCFTNMMQVITVDDDYWLHTPVQARMMRGVFPPTNPYFPHLTLEAHYGRDLWVVLVSLLSGRDIFGAQVLVTSSCQVLTLVLLYLGIRRQGSAFGAALATSFIFLGANVAHKVGLIDFFHNNGGPTYLCFAVLLFGMVELWCRPGCALALVLGLVLGHYALVYETHFGLVVLTIMTLIGLGTRYAQKLVVSLLALAFLVAVTQGGAMTSLVSPKLSGASDVVNNQSQRPQMSFPKVPLGGIRIENYEIHPISCGFYHGLGRMLIPWVQRRPARTNPHYVGIFTWNILRVHWLGLWLAPLTGWWLWRKRLCAGLFLWVFAAWAYVIPGVINFGPTHESEWFRWEVAAGIGFSGALGVALGALPRMKAWLVLVVAIAVLNVEAGVSTVLKLSTNLNNPKPMEVLGLSFPTRAWLLRHGKALHLEESDLQMFDWLGAHAHSGAHVYIEHASRAIPWDILMESTMMGLVDVEAVGHRLPQSSDPIGVPPYRRTPEIDDLLRAPDRDKARRFGLDWIVYRGQDPGVRAQLVRQFRLAIIDLYSADGVPRLLFEVETPAAPTDLGLAGVQWVGDQTIRVNLPLAPPGTVALRVSLRDGDGHSLLRRLDMVVAYGFAFVVPKDCRKVTFQYADRYGIALKTLDFDLPAKSESEEKSFRRR